MSETSPSALTRCAPLVAAYVGAAVCGYLVGARPWGRATADRGDGSTDALARVGVALGEEAPQAEAAAWAALRDDIDVARESFPAPQRQVFDLVVAIRGIENGGQPEWSRAEEQCRGLGWARCDRATLEELRKGSRP